VGVAAAYHVREENPVLLQGHSSFGDEGFCQVTCGVANLATLDVGFRLREAQSEDYKEYWRTCAEPEQGSPAVRSGID
jgi:hypothetical protein